MLWRYQQSRPGRLFTLPYVVNDCVHVQSPSCSTTKIFRDRQNLGMFPLCDVLTVTARILIFHVLYQCGRLDAEGVHDACCLSRCSQLTIVAGPHDHPFVVSLVSSAGNHDYYRLSTASHYIMPSSPALYVIATPNPRIPSFGIPSQHSHSEGLAVTPRTLNLWTNLNIRCLSQLARPSPGPSPGLLTRCLV